MKIRFVKDYTVKDDEGRSFRKDSVHDLVESSAQHFLNRGLAVAVSLNEGETAAVTAPEKAVRKYQRARPIGTESKTDGRADDRSGDVG